MLIKPLISEKSTLDIKKRNCYTFIAPSNYNKTQFKIELKKLYNIKIEYINSMNCVIKAKTNKNKKYYLNKKKLNIKKFIVKLKNESKISFVEPNVETKNYNEEIIKQNNIKKQDSEIKLIK